MINPNTSNSPSYFGYCNACNKIHSLPSEKAILHCNNLIKQLKTHFRLDFETPIENADPRLSTEHLYSELGGEMFGVLVCEDKFGKEIILRAFSSTHNGVWNVTNWVPHIAEENKFMSIVNSGNLDIHPLTDIIKTLEKGTNEWRSKILERKTVSQKVLFQLYNLYEITNFKNENRKLSDAFNNKKGIPNGTGDCCAPKLLNFAAKNKLKPISIAEFYWGKESPSGLRKEGEFYSCCENKCQPILGFMLCGS
ncbi:MAG: hypothetical protein WCH21_04380 [Bacteroidota bacterium]